MVIATACNGSKWLAFLLIGRSSNHGSQGSLIYLLNPA